MSKVWETYKHIKCSDFIAWWNKLSTKHKVEWQEEKDKISAIEGNNGVLTVYFKDGTMEVWKQSKWRKKLKKIRGRNEN